MSPLAVAPYGVQEAQTVGEFVFGNAFYLAGYTDFCDCMSHCRLWLADSVDEVATFAVHVARGQELTLPQVFTALGYFRLVQFPTSMLPWVRRRSVSLNVLISHLTQDPDVTS